MKIGKVSESILKRSVLKQIKTKRDEVIIGAGVPKGLKNKYTAVTECR